MAVYEVSAGLRKLCRMIERAEPVHFDAIRQYGRNLNRAAWTGDQKAVITATLANFEFTARMQEGK